VVGRTRRAAIDYKEPPVVEVAMSVQFEPPTGLGVAQLVLFWESRRDEFPNVRAVAPIPGMSEEFTAEGQWLPPSLGLAISNEPQCRFQMTSADDQWMCQIQLDRIVVNWRKKGEDYPRFAAAFGQFKRTWRAFEQFLTTREIEILAATLWEVVYVNRIPKGPLWNSPADWPNVFPGLWGNGFSSATGLSLRGLRGQWVWDCPPDPDPARLYVEPSPARTIENPSVELLMVNLTARGPVRIGAEGTAEDSIETGMNLGHDLIVFTFDSIASKVAKEYWKRYA
jgi:uncharacterized protein (TIGR04255 family)